MLFASATMIQEIEFAPDSPLEGNGFELSVPQCASASDSAAVVTKPNLPG
jgi:hypothetical protein